MWLISALFCKVSGLHFVVWPLYCCFWSLFRTAVIFPTRLYEGCSRCYGLLLWVFFFYCSHHLSIFSCCFSLDSIPVVLSFYRTFQIGVLTMPKCFKNTFEGFYKKIDLWSSCWFTLFSYKCSFYLRKLNLKLRVDIQDYLIIKQSILYYSSA